MMKSKNPKIQRILMKGMAISLTAMLTFTPLAYAATSLDDSSLESSIIDKLLYGTVGSTVKEIEEYFQAEGQKLYIKNETQLRAFAEYVNNGNNCEGQRIYLANDIKVNSNEEWVPIGNNDHRFKGTFDGQGHTISGLVFTRGDKKDSDLSYIGLFGVLESGTIKNITLADSKLEISYDLTKDIRDMSTDIDIADNGDITDTAFAYLGGIVGFNNYGTVENCTINSNVKISGLNKIGGIVGINWAGTVKNCTNNGTITGFRNTGGIAGVNEGHLELEYDENKKDVTGIKNPQDKEALKFSEEGDAKVLNCINHGSVYNQNGGSGGIVGAQWSNSITQSCINNGKISIATEEFNVYILGKKHVVQPQNAGGIVGWVSGYHLKYGSEKYLYYTAIDGCINNGSVIGYRDIGGIAGQLGGAGGGNTIMRNCINYTTEVEATMPINLRGTGTNYKAEEGFLAGEISPEKIGEKQGKTYLYHNMYYINKDKIGEIAIKTTNEENPEYEQTGVDWILQSREFPFSSCAFDKSNSVIKYYFVNGYGYQAENVIEGNETEIITDYFQNDYQIGADKLEMKHYNFEDSGYDYHPILTEGTSLTTKPVGTNVNVTVDTSSYLYTSSSDQFEIANSDELTQTLDSKTGTTVTYTISKNETEINGNAYFKAGDAVKIAATFNKVLYTSLGTNNSKITTITAPVLKLKVKKDEETVESNINVVTKSVSTDGRTVTYELVVDSNIANGKITAFNLTSSNSYYAIEVEGKIPTDSSKYNDYKINSGINIDTKLTASNLYIDTTAPTIKTKAYVENKLATGRYTAGKEIIIETTTSEPIQDDYTTPAIQVSFSESKIGKYNYTINPETVGYAKCLKDITNADGTHTWTYSYIIQEGDEGDVQLAYREGVITDLAGNTTVITKMYEAEEEKNQTVSNSGFPTEFVSRINAMEGDQSISGSTPSIIEGSYVNKSEIWFFLRFNDKYYTTINTVMNTETGPSLYINGIKANVSTITSNYAFYYIDLSEFTALTKISSVVLKNENSILYSSEALVGNASGIPIGATLNVQVPYFYIDPLGVKEDIKVNDIYADTTDPTVQISAQKLNGTDTSDITNNITNADTIRYTFIWNEALAEEDGRKFEASDITVNNGTKGALSKVNKNADGTYSYTMDITTNVEKGNVGDIQVIVEKGACQDLVGHENVRTESVIRIDRKAPILIGLEAYATSDVALGDSINDVKENYKTGDTVTIVATFDENIKNSDPVPTLALQFSESGNAKGNVSTGTIDGNKITYTYTIAAGDTGELSVKGFTGTVIDVAGNETRVTKRALDGDTIIADSEVPKIVGITAIAPDFEYDELLTKEDEEGNTVPTGETKKYGTKSRTREKNTITIIAEYSENIYNLTSATTEGKTTYAVNGITTAQTAPTLKLKFGSSAERTATFDKVDGRKIYYTYDIADDDDNGDLQIISLEGTVSDVAGNSLTTNTNLPDLVEFEVDRKLANNEHITADTTKPSIAFNVTAVDKDDNGNIITGNGSYYRKESIITIKATTNEYVYKNTNRNLTKFDKNNMPDISLKFGDTAAKGEITKEDVQYENNKTIFTYTYTIQDGDNGTLKLSIAENSMHDIALNGNAIKNQDVSPINADTIKPTYRDNNGDIEYKNGAYTVTFNEPLYYLENNIVKSFGDLTKAPKLKFEGLDTVYEPEISGNVITYVGDKVNAKPYLSNSSLCDKAGNLYAYYDQQAPSLSKIEITQPNDKTGKYKAGTPIEIVATFSEKVAGTAPTLKIKFGEGTERTIASGTIEDKTITYSYIVQDGDNGKLAITSYKGTGLKDLSDNSWESLEVAPTLTGGTITADTTSPTVNIKAYTNYKTSNKKEVAGKINAEITTYEFTWSEEVRDFTIEDITVMNGIKDTFTKVNDKVYTLDVINSNEGVQTVAVSSEVCTDTAKIGRYDKETGEYVVEEIGNPNESARINTVEIDRTAPSVRFITPNGGIYTTTTDSRTQDSTGIATLKARIEINENVSAFKYRVVKTGETAPEYKTVSADQINSSDIDITINNATVGEYVVEVIAIDEAGNERQAKSNKYRVTADTITLTPSTTEPTNQDITVTAGYGKALTKNRKAGVQGKTQSADSTKVIIGENGTVYAEATDIAGNKVYATLKIDSIDKTAPKATISYKTNNDGSITATITFDEDATITNNDGKPTYQFTENGEFTFEFEDSLGNKGTAIAKVTNINKTEPIEPDTPPVEEDKTAPEITFNYTTTTATVGTTIGATITSNEDAIISYSWDNENWTSSSDYTRNINAKRTPTKAGTYTLYAKATDKASNTSTVSTLQFTIVQSDDDIVKPEVIFEDLTTIQKDGVKYVKVSPTFTTAELTAKMDKDALVGKTPEYTKLTSDKGLRTGSEITIDGDIKYIIIVNGDVNCDGKVDFLNDIVMINNYRIGINKNLSDIQILAGDINNSGTIEFIPDIVAMNNYRLGRIKVL